MLKTPPKKKRYGCSFKDEWAIERAWVSKSDKGPAFAFANVARDILASLTVLKSYSLFA